MNCNCCLSPPYSFSRECQATARVYLSTPSWLALAGNGSFGDESGRRAFPRFAHRRGLQWDACIQELKIPAVGRVILSPKHHVFLRLLRRGIVKVRRNRLAALLSLIHVISFPNDLWRIFRVRQLWFGYQRHTPKKKCVRTFTDIKQFIPNQNVTKKPRSWFKGPKK